MKENLLITAKELKQPGSESRNEFSEKLNIMVEQMNDVMLNRSDINVMVGENNLEMMKDNHANHAHFMESVFENYVPEILVDTVLWVFRAYRSRNFSSTYWAAQLNAWQHVYKQNLSESTYNEILPFYKWMQVNIPIFNNLAEQQIEAPLSSH